MTDYFQLYKKTEQYVTGLFEENQSPQLYFHNLQHTKDVVERVKEIAGHYQVNEKDMLIVFVAAWFHDAGYLFSDHSMHEEKGVEVMQKFVGRLDIPEDIVAEIAACIMSTRMPRNPAGLLQEIMCDADTYHFGTNQFKTTNKLIYRELSFSKGVKISKAVFDEEALNMFQEHEFYTTYCRELLTGHKKKNMKKLKKKIQQELKEPFSKRDDEDDDESLGAITEKDGTTKGMQTMLRLTSANHIKLSDMADSKANILISVNAIIISVILSVLVRKLQTDPHLTIPTILFLAASVITIVIAILATRPKLNTGLFNQEDVLNKKTNLLFFGNFHKMTLDQYEKAMRIMVKDSDYLYSSIIQDIYHLGTVLGKKYRLIRLAYNIFMIGIVVSVVAFAIAAITYTEPAPGVINSNSSGSPF